VIRVPATAGKAAQGLHQACVLLEFADADWRIAKIPLFAVGIHDTFIQQKRTKIFIYFLLIYSYDFFFFNADPKQAPSCISLPFAPPLRRNLK
jgi:hypothetical protein